MLESIADIGTGDAVYVLYREGGVCVVEKQSEVLDIINEHEENAP